MKLTEWQDEQYWIDLYHQGDEKALAYFFAQYYRPLCYFARKLVQSDEEAEDIVSGCFIKLWQSDRKVTTAANIKAFLYISCRNACLNYLRDLKVKTTAQQAYFDQLLLEEDTVLVNIVESEVLAILEKEIALLPEKCQQVFRLFYFEQLKTPQVMEKLSMNEKSVRYYKAKAIEMLRTAMLKKGLSEGLYLAFLFFLNKK